MKNLLFYTTIFLYSFFTNVQAAQTIPCYVINEIWPEKTKLTGIITYRDQHTEEVSLVVEGTTTESLRIEQCINLSSGAIKEFNLFLNHYHEESDRNDAEKTLIGSLVFKPVTLLTEISLEFAHLIIHPNPTYNLPSKFQYKKENS
jgi:hypothetical protein